MTKEEEYFHKDVDGRGSKDQRTLFEYLLEIYPYQKVVYEYYIAELNQRIDIFIPSLGIAIEYSGRQHSEYVEHFHRGAEGYLKSRELDRQKIEYLESIGAKLIIIYYNKMVKDSKELKDIIDSTPYPEIDYELKEDEKSSKRLFLDQQKERRKELYRKQKELRKNESKCKKT